MQLAQLNIGRLLAPIDDLRIAEFKANLDRINGLAESSPGFVWRLKDDSNNATGMATPFGPQVIANLSVWRDLESLRAFTYKSAHAAFIRRRSLWFEDHPGRHLVLWWVADGHRPDLDEAGSRPQRLEARGPCPAAFIFSRSFDDQGRPRLPPVRRDARRRRGASD